MGAPPNPNAIIVAPCQKGNPVLKAIKNVPWQYGETTADYLLSDTTCALFLSLRYHLRHPHYLARRLRELLGTYSLRVVLLLMDSDDAEGPVLEITRAAMMHDCTAILAWSVKEAARYLETLRAYARKPADLIKERTDGAFVSQLAECLTVVRPINKTDVGTLHARFGSLSKLMNATQEELSTCPGLGDRKVRPEARVSCRACITVASHPALAIAAFVWQVRRLREAFTEPFVPHSARGRAAQAPTAPAEGEGVAVSAVAQTYDDASEL